MLSVRVYIIELVKTITFPYLDAEKGFQTLNTKSPYRMPLCDFLISNCPCSMKLLLAIKSVDYRIEIVNSKENCFIFFKLEGIKAPLLPVFVLKQLV